jgi:hypothetical protein
VQLLIFDDRGLSRSLPPQNNAMVDIVDHRHVGVLSAEAYVMAAVRADGADAKELNPSGLNAGLSAAGSPAGSDHTFARIPRVWSRLLDCGAPDRCPAGQRGSLLYL